MTGKDHGGSTEFHYVLLYDLSQQKWYFDDASCFDLEAAVAMLNDDGDDATA